MINFIKNLFGFGSAQEQETIKEILTPPAKSDPLATAVTAATYIEPAKPINKVRAVSETGAQAVAEATAPKPANKQRRPYRGNKIKVKPASPAAKPAQVAKVKSAKKK
jgi:hypothetical protein